MGIRASRVKIFLLHRYAKVDGRERSKYSINARKINVAISQGRGAVVER